MAELNGLVKRSADMNHDLDSIFDNLPKLLRPHHVEEHFGTPRATVYDWHYRPGKYAVPEGMILKDGRKLVLVASRYKTWLISRLSK